MEKLKKFLVEDWVATLLSAPLLIIAACATLLPKDALKISSELQSADSWINIGGLYVIAYLLLCLGNRLLSRPLQGLFSSFFIIFVVSMLAQLTAKVGFVKAWGFEAVFFSVIYGLIARNIFYIPEWLKPAIQGEFFIKIGVVCLGATILFRDFIAAGSLALVQGVIVVFCVWMFAFFLARRVGVDDRSAMTLASGVSICGVSACITAAGVANADGRKLSYIASVVLIVVVPMIYIMPYMAKLVTPLLTDDPTVAARIAGAWIGGTVDTTSGVGAASAIYGDEANKIAMIVKAAQNLLIGVVAFFIALFLSSKESGNGKLHRPSLRIVWDKFPKFVLGFVLASAIFSLLQSYEVFPDFDSTKLAETTMAKNFSNFFFSLAFVCIGMDTRLKDIASRKNRNVLLSFVFAQAFNIIFTFFIAWLLFGVLM